MGGFNRRKKSIILDLKTRAHRVVAQNLVARTDVLVENFRPGVMARFGGGLETPEEHAHLGTIDVLAGIAGAFASAAALFNRARTGKPDVARCSLAAAGQLIQAPFMYDFPGREPFDEPSGRDARGYCALYRIYETSDGWLFLAAPASDLAHLCSATDSPDLAEMSGERRIARLTECFLSEPTSVWIDRLRAREIGVAHVRSLAELREAHIGDDSAGGSYCFDRFAEHPCGRVVKLISPCAVRPRRSMIKPPFATEKYGASARGLLRDLGFAEDAIESFLEGGIVSEGWSSVYLPD